MDYVMQLIDMWCEGKMLVIELILQVVVEFVDYIVKGVMGMVWVGGCQSWYLDVFGQLIIFFYDWSEFLCIIEKLDLVELVMIFVEDEVV